MLELKKPIIIDDQVEKLKEHKLIIEKRSEVKRFITWTGYYRFTGYMLQFRTNENGGALNPKYGVTFDDIKTIYEFDSELRDFLLHYLGIVEVYFRAVIAYEASRSLCERPPHTQHYCRDKYKKKDEFDDILKKIEDRLQRYGDKAVKAHHDKKYEGKYPLWVWVDLMSFSTLSKYYSCLNDYTQGKIRKRLNETGAGVIEENMHSLSVLRNSCAHAGRLYNNTLNPPPHFSPGELDRKDLVINKVFAFVLTIVKYLPTIEMQNSFIEGFDALIKKYRAMISDEKFDLHEAIGLTDDYLDWLTKNKKTREELAVEIRDYIAINEAYKAEEEDRKKHWINERDKAARLRCSFVKWMIMILLAGLTVLVSVTINKLTASQPNGTLYTLGVLAAMIVLNLMVITFTDFRTAINNKLMRYMIPIANNKIRKKMAPTDWKLLE